MMATAQPHACLSGRELSILHADWSPRHVQLGVLGRIAVLIRRLARFRQRLAEHPGAGGEGRAERKRRPLVVRALDRGSLRVVRYASRPALSGQVFPDGPKPT